MVISKKQHHWYQMSHYTLAVITTGVPFAYSDEMITTYLDSPKSYGTQLTACYTAHFH